MAYTNGLQWGEDARYTKAVGALKHYTIYSVEDSGGHGARRGSSYFPIAMRDIEDTYLPQFKAPVVEAGSLGYMCSYAALTSPSISSDSASHPHSEPCCASKFFAVTKMEKEYGFKGYVQSDCGAVGNMLGALAARRTQPAACRHADAALVAGGEHYAANASDAAAKAIVDGKMNSNCGSGLMGHACDAIAQGLMTQQDLVDRVTRSFTLLMGVGLFDPVELQTYTKYPFSVVNSPSAVQSNLLAARQSLVLVKNGDAAPVLPLRKGARLALIGPHTQTQKDLAGNYFEDIGLGMCAGVECVPTLKTAFDKVSGGSAAVAAGCDIKCEEASYKAGKDAALAAARGAEVVVLALGIDGDIAGEGRDRMDIRLPGYQQQLAQDVIGVGKPTVLLLFSGGLIDIGDLKLADIAVVQGWFPGATGGTAVAETVFGEQNRFGKLPFTWYASNFTAASDFDNMNMTDGPGRTYKYLKDPSLALWPAFYGLSYTTFAISAQRLGTAELRAADAHAATRASVTVQNTGAVSGDEVVFLFKNSSAVARHWAHGRAEAPSPSPRRELVGFQRVTLAPGESTTVHFNVTAEALSSVDARGTRHALAGEHELTFSRGHGEELSLPLRLAVARPQEEGRLVISSLAGLFGMTEDMV